jgi:hypothetical protein
MAGTLAAGSANVYYWREARGIEGVMPNESEQRISLIRPQIWRDAKSARRNSGASLLKWRAWFADEDRDGQSGNQDDEGGEGEPATLDEAKRLIKALHKRVEDKAREKDEAVRLANERVEKAEAERKKKLAEEGNFKTLAEQATAEAESLRGYKDRATSLEQVIRESNDGRIKNLPESARDLVPTDYAPEKLQAWLNKNEALLKKPPAPNFDGGAGNGSGGSGKRESPLTEEEKLTASLMGVTPEQYAQAKKALGLG